VIRYHTGHTIFIYMHTQTVRSLSSLVMNSKQTITVLVTIKSVQRFPLVITVILRSQKNEYIHQNSEANYCNKNVSNKASSYLTLLTHLLGMH